MAFGFIFLRLALRLLAVFTVIVLLARLVGGTRPASPIAAVFSQPDGTPCDQPCVFGVRPGETTAADAREMIEAHPLARNAEWITDTTLKLAGPDTYLVFRQTRAGVIESIALTASRTDDGAAAASGSLMDSIMLGDYMQVYDITQVATPPSEYVVFLAPDSGTFAGIARPDDFSEHIEATIPLALLIVSVVVPCYKSQDYMAGGLWTGFTTVAHYYSQRTPVATLPSLMSMPPTRPCQL